MPRSLPERQGQHVERRRPPAIRLTLGITLLLAGAAVLLLQLLFPTQIERAVGEAKVIIQEVVQDASPTYPTVTLGPLGGKREMNWCDGRFIELESYRISGVPPVYAAHNNCGGDIILSWNIGDHVQIAGSDTVYEVVEERHTKKWGNVGSLRGMQGDLLLQTCYYGQDKMRFLALTPVA